MRIDENIDGKCVIFTRHCFSGRAELSVDDMSLTLQSPYDPETHYSFSLNQVLTCQVDDHVLLIQITRPLLFAGFRPQTYRLYVDGQLLVERHGY